ncbi:alpha-D-ribose 1-methylphosphonate 5-triphosphate diphosphatase [Cryptosporangium phraense]|uniref:Alpha-D-ribose 1-methylphosphonate 5-triphosphate diphosphatase n=1 Tax=Cryptosporangium phraense TaxID=2593070 RepID=A0A545AL82_9ACTN|nr:alpha-D-ribose 1-methylphosphonate 5-triphosphate diphosphatase [Cryptosporangium phraense]TQS42073.1 alpha-D-ribose 1-methylphosphonate 5-triphosphate diphosphatase [Cryptosporangium phraense]
MTETVLRNATLVLPDSVLTGSVVVRDGVIVDLDTGGTTGSAGSAGEDLDGDYLLPGLVEVHTDHLEYHVKPRPGTEWDAVPAVLAHDAQLTSSGVTTVLDALRVGSDPRHYDTAALQDAAPALAPRMAAAIAHSADAGILRADHYLHLRCEVPAPDCVDVFDTFAGDPRVLLVSLMDHTPGARQFASLDAFRRYTVGKGRVSDAEFDEYVRFLQSVGAEYADKHRAAIAERVRERGLRLATHDDATVEHVAESVAIGGTIAEFPTTVAAARAAVESGQQTVMGAPNLVLGGSQSGNVSAAEILAEGLLDILSSDYVPSSPLQAVFHLHSAGTLPIEAGARLVSTNPARAVGLDDRGEIAIGQRADLVRVHAHDSANGPRSSFPVVRGVWRAGRRVC